jgi:uncharacterized protein YbaR (Trm112 family)
MDNKLLEILVCPICKGALRLNMNKNELHCRNDRIAFPIRNMIPVLLEEEGRKILLEEM